MNPISGFDITIPCSLGINQDNLISIFRKNCKQFVFQKEKGEKTGMEHFQCRIRLKKKTRFSTLKKKGFFVGGHWAPTSKDVYIEGDMFYVMKDETRLEGPWTDKDEVKVLTKQLKRFLEFEHYAYQKAIIDTAAKYDERTIYLIYDTHGNLGKSILGEYMEYIGLAEEIPSWRMMDDIMQWVMSRGAQNGFKKAYLVDMPRGMKKDKMADFWSGIETVKNGVAFDKRHYAKKARFDRPQIFVFTNVLPKFNLMSKDRWKIWEIQKDHSYLEKLPKDYDNEEKIGCWVFE